VGQVGEEVEGAVMCPVPRVRLEIARIKVVNVFLSFIISLVVYCILQQDSSEPIHVPLQLINPLSTLVPPDSRHACAFHIVS
jgi:hypothetical protein